MRSIFRGGERIPLDEFLNVSGRAGRPFVDIDGQIIFAAHGTDRASHRRLEQWRAISEEVLHRELKSGIVALVADIIARLATIGVETPTAVSEYVLGMTLINSQNEESRAAAKVESDLRWLDEAVLSLLGQDSDCSAAEFAQKLDDVCTDRCGPASSCGSMRGANNSTGLFSMGALLSYGARQLPSSDEHTILPG